jgi:hypothetical protein
MSNDLQLIAMKRLLRQTLTDALALKRILGEKGLISAAEWKQACHECGPAVDEVFQIFEMDEEELRQQYLKTAEGSSQ